jgi:hypothetical protein
MSSAIRGALIFLITLSAIIVWLPFSRSWMDGDSYVWGLPILGLDLSGRGLGGAYWVLPPLVALPGVSLWAGWRGSRRIFGVLSGLWFMIWFVSVVVMRSTDGPIMFYGDTLDVAYDISAMAMAISGTGLMASFVMIRAPSLTPRACNGPRSTRRSEYSWQRSTRLCGACWSMASRMGRATSMACWRCWRCRCWSIWHSCAGEEAPNRAIPAPGPGE